MSFSSRVGPPSPSSPHPGSQKDHHQPGYPSDHIPQTPTSPPLLMSISAQNYASSFTSSQTSPSQATSQSQDRGHNLASPPSSAPMSTQPSQQQTVTATNSFPTPASSVNGYMVGGSAAAGEPEHASKPVSGERRHVHAIAKPDSTIDPSIQTEHRRTDHERQFTHDQKDVLLPTSNSAGSVPDEDAMDVDDRILSSSRNRNAQLESLQKEFSSPFHLCRGCKGSLSSSRFLTSPLPITAATAHLSLLCHDVY